MSRRKLSGKRVILTGASSGLGNCLAHRLAAENVRLVVNARSSEKLDRLVTELQAAGTECCSVVGDIVDLRTREQLLAACMEHYGGLDCLINNAGITALGRFESGDPHRLRRVFEVNFFAAAELIRSCLPSLQQGNDSVIVNISSVLGHRAVPLKSEYCASKFALHGFSDALRAELAARGIGVLLVSPSTIASQFLRKAIEDNSGREWNVGSAVTPQWVADRIVNAIRNRKHELIVPMSGKLLVWFDRFLPGLANRLIARFGQ
jgi:short-subunit dehydrogenase